MGLLVVVGSVIVINTVSMLDPVIVVTPVIVVDAVVPDGELENLLVSPVLRVVSVAVRVLSLPDVVVALVSVWLV